jgi:hypothetical protein
MSTQHELKLQEQLQAREEESVKKDQEILTLKDQMQQMAVTMQQQMDMMEQLKLQLKGTPKGASKATVEPVDKEIEKEARREEAKTVEIMKLAVPVLEWGGKNFELWEEKVKLVLMSRQWKDVGVALEGVGTEEVTTVVKKEGKLVSPVSVVLPKGVTTTRADTFFMWLTTVLDKGFLPMQKRAAKKACGWTRLVALWGGIIGKFRVNSLIGRAATQQRWNDLKQGVDENFTTFVERVDACAEELNNLYAASGSSKRVDAEDKKTKFLLCLNPTSKEMFSATIKSMSQHHEMFTR